MNAPSASTQAAPAAIAKGALRRLAHERLEPTPANYARAYAEEAGDAGAGELLPSRMRSLVERLAARVVETPTHRAELASALMRGRGEELQHVLERSGRVATEQAQVWAMLIDRLARALERGSRGWTMARKKESLQRVLEGSRSDSLRLQQRLRQLLASWDEGPLDPGVDLVTPDASSGPVADAADASVAERTRDMPATDGGVGGSSAAAPDGDVDPAPAVAPVPAADDAPLRTAAACFGRTLTAALPTDEPRAAELADELAALAARIASAGATRALVDDVAAACARAERLFAHRHHLVDELGSLCRSLTEGLTELAEQGSWAQGQGRSLRARLDQADGVRGVRAARELLEQTRAQQQALRVERESARDALKAMMQHMLSELAELGGATGRFNDRLTGYADVIARADTLDGLAGVVREMVGETHAVNEVVAGTRDRLVAEHRRATELESRVRELEGELRRLSDEVSTDALTQIANRRGMLAAFDAERSRIENGAAAMSIGLIDIDNFKRLNDSLGHAAGDEALKALAVRIREWLRPGDHVARFGGEEFVVLMPATGVDEAQQALTRLQRQLSASLFMHDEREVFVTFSAGVTTFRGGEALESALERADEALYEAKRTGKNRTCVA